MSTPPSRSRANRVPRWRRIVARVSALTCLLAAAGALYLVADGTGLSTDDLSGGGGGDDERTEIHEIATFGAGKDEDVAVGESGRVGVIFRRPTPTGTQTLARLGTAKGGFGPLRRLSRTSSSRPRIEVNDEGVAVAMWVTVDPAQLKRVQIAIAAPGQRFGPPRTLDRTPGWIKVGGVTIGEEGDVTATWRRDGRSRIARRRDGQFAASRDTTNESAAAVETPQLDDRENALVAQIRQRADVQRVVEVAAAGDHVVCAYRKTAAGKGHLEIVSLY